MSPGEELGICFREFMPERQAMERASNIPMTMASPPFGCSPISPSMIAGDRQTGTCVPYDQGSGSPFGTRGMGDVACPTTASRSRLRRSGRCHGLPWVVRFEDSPTEEPADTSHVQRTTYNLPRTTYHV